MPTGPRFVEPMTGLDINYTYYPSDSSDTAVRDSERCAVEGCSKKQCYYEYGRERSRIYSKFCHHHTCERTFPVEEGYHCAHPKRREYRYCTDHQKCTEPGCRELGEFRGREGDPFVPYACDQHRCTAPRCLSRAENSQQRRCAVHTVVCSVEGCDRPCHLHRDGHLDLACAVHYGSFQCAWAGCTRRRPGYDVKYCLAHKCAALPGCANGRDPAGGHVCVAHRCTVRSCPNAVADPSNPASRTCRQEHTCKSPRCLQPRLHLDSSSSSSTPPSDFCRAHACAVPGCPREAAGNPAAGGSRYCAERHACVVAGCAEPRLGVRSGQQQLRLQQQGERPSSSSSPLLLSPDALPLSSRCVEHELRRERRRERAASVETRVPPVDFDALRDRLDWDQRRKRLSDDVGRMRGLEREREERERRERERGEAYELYPGWERWYER